MRFDIRSGKIVPVEPEQPATRSVPVASVEKSNAPDPNARWVVWDPKTRAPAVAPAVNKKRSADSSSIPANPKSGSWQELAKLNNITDPRKLQANSWIKTPSGEIYVNKGDTLSGIAQKIRAAQRRGVSEEESEAAAQRKQYPSYYQHKDAGTIFRTQNDAGQRMDITPDDEEWDDYYKQQFPDMPTPNDGGFWNADNTAAYVEESAGQVVFSGTGANGSTYEIIQSRDGFMIHANGRPIDTYGSLQRAMRVLQNEVPGLQQGVAEDDGFDDMSSYTNMSTTDTGNKSNQTYTSTAIAKNPATGQQKSLASWDYTDPKTGKNYSGTNYIDPQGNAEVQKNYEESVLENNSGPVTHRIGLTVTDPNHPMVSKRKEPYQKSIRITQNVSDREAAINQAIAHYRRKGYKVHDHHYIGTVDDEPVNELDKKTVASWVRQQPQRIKGDTGLSRTNFKKAKRLVDKSIPSALSKIKDPGYGQQEPRLDEVSLGKYREKAMADKALAQANKFFGRDDPAAVAAADRTIAKRERGLGRADARSRPYTAPPVDQDKQRRDLADKYPNIDELVRQAELRRDPQYDRADGPAYYAGRDAEHNYHRLKQIQRMIRGTELDEMNFGGVGQVTDSDTGDITTSFNQGPVSVSQTKTPGGYTKQTDQRFDLGPATIAQKTVGPNIGAGQLAGTTTRTATNNMTGQSQQQVRGVGFGGATGANVGKNYVGSSDDELAQHAASVFNTNESIDRIKHLAGVKPVR
jgi:hypothetical protein